MTYLKPIITVLWSLITTHFFCFGWHFPAVCASAPCRWWLIGGPGVWHTRYNVNVHYCVIIYPTLKLSFQERISTLTEKTKDDLLRRMREKHPQFVATENRFGCSKYFITFWSKSFWKFIPVFHFYVPATKWPGHIVLPMSVIPN
jgi:hypothetical protein